MPLGGRYKVDLNISLHFSAVSRITQDFFSPSTITYICSDGTHALCLPFPLPFSRAAGVAGGVCATVGGGVDTSTKPAVIGESLQRVPASSLVAAAWRWAARGSALAAGGPFQRCNWSVLVCLCVCQRRSWSRACQSRYVNKLSGGQKKTSVNVSLACDSCNGNWRSGKRLYSQV